MCAVEVFVFFFNRRDFTGAGQTAYGTPVDRISLGETSKTVDNFLKFLEVFFYSFSILFSWREMRNIIDKMAVLCLGRCAVCRLRDGIECC